MDKELVSYARQLGNGVPGSAGCSRPVFTTDQETVSAELNLRFVIVKTICIDLEVLALRVCQHAGD